MDISFVEVESNSPSALSTSKAKPKDDENGAFIQTLRQLFKAQAESEESKSTESTPENTETQTAETSPPEELDENAQTASESTAQENSASEDNAPPSQSPQPATPNPPQVDAITAELPPVPQAAPPPKKLPSEQASDAKAPPEIEQATQKPENEAAPASANTHSPPIQTLPMLTTQLFQMALQQNETPTDTSKSSAVSKMPSDKAKFPPQELAAKLASAYPLPFSPSSMSVTPPTHAEGDIEPKAEKDTPAANAAEILAALFQNQQPFKSVNAASPLPPQASSHSNLGQFFQLLTRQLSFGQFPISSAQNSFFGLKQGLIGVSEAPLAIHLNAASQTLALGSDMSQTHSAAQTTAEIGAPLTSIHNTSTASESPHQAPPTSSDSGRPQALMRTIVQNIRYMHTHQRSEIRMTLDPPHLGKMVLQLSQQQDGQMHLHMLVDPGMAKEVLEGSLQQLRQQFQAQGLQLDQIVLETRQEHQDDSGASGQQAYEEQTDPEQTVPHSETLIDDLWDEDAPQHQLLVRLRPYINYLV